MLSYKQCDLIEKVDKWRKKVKVVRIKFIPILMILILSFILAACGSNGKKEKELSENVSQTESQNETAKVETTAVVSESESKTVDLTGKSLMIYSGAGMKAPMTKISEEFEKDTGCTVDLTFGNGAQINSQITTTNKGDLFIAGAATELENLKNNNMVTESKDLVKHIPVIAVPKGNEAGVATISDLGKVRLVLGDAESTPIGKIANAVLKDEGILDKANIVARTSTAPEMITALSTGEADAAIVWKENAENKDGVEVLDIAGMNKYIKTIPAASLSCSENAEALEAFLRYLDTDKVHDIWTEAGYVVVE